MPKANETQAVAMVYRALDFLTDDELLTVHREVSRRAAAIRADDPEYQRRYEAGMAQQIARP